MDTIIICTCHDEQVPLLMTFAFRGSEYWCPACGYNAGMFEAGKDVPETVELIQKKKEWQKKTRAFLDAKSSLSCSSLKFKGKEINPAELPENIREKYKKIISEFKYEIQS